MVVRMVAVALIIGEKTDIVCNCTILDIAVRINDPRRLVHSVTTNYNGVVQSDFSNPFLVSQKKSRRTNKRHHARCKKEHSARADCACADPNNG